MKKRRTISISFNQKDNALIKKAVRYLEDVTELPRISRAQAVRVGLQVLLNARASEVCAVVSEMEVLTPGRPRNDGSPKLGYQDLKKFLLATSEPPERLYRVRFDKNTEFCPQWINPNRDIKE